MIKHYSALVLSISLLVSIATPLAVNQAQANEVNKTKSKYDSSNDTDIKGRDIDQDGLRDDIQDYIENNYAGHPILRGELIRYSKSLDALMLAKGLKGAIEATKGIDGTKYCAQSKGYNSDEFLLHTTRVYNLQVNTNKRLIAATLAERMIMNAAISMSRDKPYSEYCEPEGQI
ncbi:hypothetical protein [Pseudoalteromonas sp. SR45-4]|uniref:hypothetical protein n=1 Tax=Pseudoalteromonas sp. SR45-4 TaxID=2760929 RepID=UPI0015FB27D2|nr:hypothetical protein [Pseudoalteromonas sp. SR45-4]MBB1371262.1 hypothetical protein [Pseudoalteromonas sp. SR45-4]